MAWLNAPTGNGLYWAYADDSRNKHGPSMCKVSLKEGGSWTATFISGMRTYTFADGKGWLWQPVKKPAIPRGRSATPSGRTS